MSESTQRRIALLASALFLALAWFIHAQRLNSESQILLATGEQEQVIASLQAKSTIVEASLPSDEVLQRLRADHEFVQKLRNDIAAYGSEAARPLAENAAIREAAMKDRWGTTRLTNGTVAIWIPVAEWVSDGTYDVRSVVETMLLASRSADFGTIRSNLVYTDDIRTRLRTAFDKLQPEERARYGTFENYAAALFTEKNKDAAIFSINEYGGSGDRVTIGGRTRTADFVPDPTAMPSSRNLSWSLSWQGGGWKVLFPESMIPSP